MYKAAVYCGTRNVYKNMVTAAKSLTWHTKVDRIYFIIEDKHFPEELPDFVECINASGQRWFLADNANRNDHRTWMNLIRLALPKMLAEDVVLSLDNDTIVVDEISELWDIPLGDNYFAGVREPAKSGSFPYINTGVSLHNLKLLREGMCDRLIGIANMRRFACPIQDSIISLCLGRIRTIDGRYNVSNYTESSAEPAKILHFAAEPNYEQYPIWQMYAQSDWRT